ncbi:MAG: NAD(P)-dependent oxidoreductase [Flavobacterium sp.]|jgi:alanine dehydrogenase|uniref:NAD(P)-dependent oxidoreductase n=1 Tax=Flavobacterium sp. TaxID=239 RepID=UPI0022C54566|nr:NAD(P)-dependent oxidoreductase [Flavobacterium sp.]MCZ8168629.1 NAD(P)-dependent oxidoreductase [Flavobacterium sp.]MCZ8297170.1 NAD(P)-dependent oxidoreductase [Flavobacterium sp.]
MVFGIVKERKSPPDRRVVFTPEELVRLQQAHPEVRIKVETSDIRVFPDEAYRTLGLEVTTDMQDCDVLFGVKEIPVDALLPGKKYFFFSHTIKKQPYNRALLQAILAKKIELYDHETIVDAQNKRLIGFGRYAGIVGAYNGFRGFGIKYELFTLPKAETLQSKDDLIARLKRILLPNIKIVLTGKGKVGMGAKEILDGMKMKSVSVEDFLTKTYTEPVYTHIDVMDYNVRLDGQYLGKSDFYAHPEAYTSHFERFTKVADVFMAGHFHANGSPDILTQAMLQAPDCKLKVVADISCDVNGPIACTTRATTIADPFMGYLPREHREVPYTHPGAIMVMSVDNLPCELPKDASEGFGEMFMEHVVPAFFNGDKDGILQRAKMTENGQLTPRFAYLQDYVDGH